jgi:hypothetical protein
MSEQFYPLGLLESLKVRVVDRTESDEFEAGTTATRQLWAPGYFKRRFEVKHTALTPSEFDTLRDFFTARGGRYDSFWFRDNVHRTGNAKVRLAQGFDLDRARAVYRPELVLEEVAPTRALPGAAQMAEAMWAGAAQLYPVDLLLDANRQSFYWHGTTKVRGTELYDGSPYHRHLTWTLGPKDNITATAAQQNFFWSHSYGNPYAVAATQISTYQVRAMVFACINKAVSSGVLFSVGSAGSGTALGIRYDATAGAFVPYFGNMTDTWVGTVVPWTGDPMTLAFIWDPYTATDECVLAFKNGALVGAEGESVCNGIYNLGAGISCMCDPAGGNKPAGAEASPFVFTGYSADLTPAQAAAAMHNLHAYQLGLSTV